MFERVLSGMDSKTLGPSAQLGVFTEVKGVVRIRRIGTTVFPDSIHKQPFRFAYINRWVSHSGGG